MAGPSGGMVVDGVADILGQGSNAVTVNQHSNRAVINWQSFDTQSHQRVEFVQPDANSIVLNRIISGSPTQFDGSLTANGRVVVMNPNGVVFGQTAQVDVGSLIATSSHVSTDSFMNDAQIRFEAGSEPAGSIVNHGTITVRDAGLVGFVAPHVENTGTITARMGTVHLASGDRFTFDLYGDGLVEIAASDAINAQLVKNSGSIKADGGVVQLEAASAKTMVDGLVSNTGVIEAKSVHEKNGVIILSGDAATTSVSGTVDASGKGASETGGRIEVTGKEINLASARLDASGSEGGGTIRIGGGYQGGESIPQADTTTVDADTTITADAITNGDGGSIVVWSNELTDISATLSAKGGMQSGDGGIIETSSKGRATFQDAISIDTSARNGKTGLWYIDPEDFTIADVGGDITPVVLSGQLGSNNVTIETADTGSDAGDIVVEDALSWGSDRTLILNAHRDIDINASINNTNGGSLVLRSDKAGSGTGTVSFIGAGSVTMTGGGRTDIYYNPSAYSTPTDYSGSITGPFTAWMLVHDVNQLQAINTNNTTRAGSYALSRDIDASDTVNWNSGAGFNPIGNNSNRFTGQFDGQNHVITDLTINRPMGNHIGLFGYAEGATIQNVGLTNVDITGNRSGSLVDTATNNTEISHSYATGRVVGIGTEDAGGLVGLLAGSTIIHSYAHVDVTGGGYDVGGLVGQNNGTISHSYATGNVTQLSGNRIGGLVGWNRGGGTPGEIYNSWSSGLVTTGATSAKGGLLGLGSSGSTVTNSYWDMDTSGMATSAGGAGAVGLTSAQARQQASYVGWDFGDDWYMIEGQTRPFGRWEYSTDVGNAHQLQLINIDLDADYTLVRDIDLGDALAPVGGEYTGMWTENGFVPLGTVGNRFSGQFDGQNHIITDLTINRPSTDNIGLFGYTDGAIIRNVGLVDIDVTGNSYVGGLVGHNSFGSAISDSYTTGSLMASFRAGGIVGQQSNSSTISSSYANVDISGVTGGYVGGLVAYNANSIIRNSYSTGNVSGSSLVGGLVGRHKSGSLIENSYSSGLVSGSNGGLIDSMSGDSLTVNSYWNVDTSGHASSAGGAGVTGLTTAEMQQMDSFASWDIDDVGGTGTVWRIYEGQTSPLLRHFMTPLTVTAHNDSTLYDGTVYTGGNGVVWSGFKDGEDATDLSGVLSYGGTAQNAMDAGSYLITPVGMYSDQQGYDITAQSGTLTISPRDITITADAISRDYGDTNPALTYTVGGDGLVNSDTLSGSLATTATVTSNIGNYAITQGDLSNANYTITAYTGNDLTVTPRDITVTADAVSRVYGDANPSLTYTVGADGLVNSDTLFGSLTTTATVTSDIGNYAITQGDLSNANYTITAYTGNDLTVTQRNLVIAAQDKMKIQGQDNPALTYAIGGNGLANGDTPLSGSLATTAVTLSPVGGYTITQGSVGINDTNYSMVFIPGTLTIALKPDMPASTEAGRYSTGSSDLVTGTPGYGIESGISSSSGITTDGPMYNVDILNGGINLDNNSFDLNLISPSASGDTDTVTNQTSNAYTIYFTKPLLQQLGYLK